MKKRRHTPTFHDLRKKRRGRVEDNIYLPSAAEKKETEESKVEEEDKEVMIKKSCCPHLPKERSRCR